MMFKKLVVLISFILMLGLISSGAALGAVYDISIAEGGDDAEQHLDDGDMDIGSSDLELAYEDAGEPATDEQVVALRFLDIPAEKGALIYGAYVEIEVDKVDKLGSEAPVNLIIEGELVPDAAAFEDVANNITDRAVTTAKVQWSIPAWTEQDAKFQTPDISSILQEIVGQEGWESGNAIVLIFRDDKDNPSTGLREAESYSGEAEAAPLLHFGVADELDIPVADGNDDAEQHLDDGDMDIGSSDLELAYEDAGDPATDEQVVGLRFLGIPIDKGAPVFNAYVEVEVDKVDKQGSEAPVNLIIEGELVPDAAAFEDVANNITDRAVTTAKVKWSIPAWTEQDAKFQTPDISSILQELVNQEGWESGNAIVLILRDDKDDPSTGLREAESFEGESEAAPKLHIVAQFTVIEVASAPIPADGAGPVATGTTLSWTPNSKAVSHDVYFGASSPPELVGNQDANTYYPGLIETNTTYYWQIDEVLEDGTIIAGDIWSFTTGLGNISVDSPILEGNDDGEDHIAYGDVVDDGSETRGSSDLEMPWEDDVQTGSYQVVGLRFTDLSIAKGATILKASVQFTADNEKLSGGPVNLIINGLLQPDTNGLGGGENFFEREPKTVAEVNWTDVPEWTNSKATAESMTPDITSIIQEIVNQDDWAAGNALMLFVRDDETNPSAGIRSALSGDGGVTVAPRLLIEAISEAAVSLAPADGATDVEQTVVLSWLRGFSAVSYDVYLGKAGAMEFMGNQTGTTFTLTEAGYSAVYSWRVDAIDADGVIYTGATRSFSTPSGQATNPDPADGSVLAATSGVFSWVAGPSAVMHDGYVGTDPDALEYQGSLSETMVMIGVPGGPIPDGLVPGTTYYWRIDEVEADPSVVHTGEVWSFTVPPLSANNPVPADGAELASDAVVVLSWTAGLDAKLHSVYFGDDLDTVTNAVGAPPKPLLTYDPGPLEAGKTYYWRVDEFNPPATVKGEVWSFSLAAP